MSSEKDNYYCNYLGLLLLYGGLAVYRGRIYRAYLHQTLPHFSRNGKHSHPQASCTNKDMR